MVLGSGDSSSTIGLTLPPGAQLGQVVGGKFRIDRVLGAGGMGFVMAAHHLQLDEQVAIKFLLPEIAQNKEAVARFVREGRAAIKIKSEYIARVTDVGSLDDGTPYMVMEFLDGRDLSAWLRDDGALSVDDTVEFVLQTCEAVAEAHRLGIVHRDLKPANLFVVRRADGLLAVRVLDFGISKMTGARAGGASVAVTRTTDLVGSPQFMSPEQLLSFHEVDARTDVWALGVVLYNLVTGHLPFDGDTVPILCSRILQAAPLPPRSHRPDLPPGLDGAILKCLEKDRTQRFQNVAELAGALQPFAPARARGSVERIVRTVAAAAGAASGAPVSSVAPVPGATERKVAAAPVATQVLPSSTTPLAFQNPVSRAVADVPEVLPPRERSRSTGVWTLRLVVGGGLAAIGLAWAVLHWSPPRRSSTSELTAQVAATPAPVASSPPVVAPPEAQRPPTAAPVVTAAPDVAVAPAEAPAAVPAPSATTAPAVAVAKRSPPGPARPKAKTPAAPTASKKAPASLLDLVDDRK